LVVLLGEASAARKVDLSDQNLTRMPFELIPKETILLKFGGNYLKILELQAGYTSLETIVLKQNQLSTFPDLREVGTTLTKLLLPNNNISYIKPDFLNALTALEELNLGFNSLTTIPDVSGPGGSLSLLKIYHNPLQKFPSMRNIGKTLKELGIGDTLLEHISFRQVSEMPNLEILGVSNVTMRHLPNLCHVKTARLDVNIKDNVNLICDWRLAWLQLVPLQRFNLLNNQTTCIANMTDIRTLKTVSSLQGEKVV
jgi:Leucine-rich repeat (LRR) protein